MSTPLDGLNHSITLGKAVQMTTLYREQKDAILNAAYLGKNILPISESFNRDALDQILAQKDCIGMRIYYSMDQELKLHAILVGVNTENADILPNSTSITQAVTSISNVATDDEGFIAEESIICPPACPPASQLNS